MRRVIPLGAVFAGAVFLFAGTSYAVAPPVFQTLGKADVAFGSQTEASCRVCHASGVPNRHHQLYGAALPATSVVPVTDADGNGTRDTVYSCISCHRTNFTLERNCLACHNTGSPHHTAAKATAPVGGQTVTRCKFCHGSLVDEVDDNHYIPTYSPSLVTPYPTGGVTGPANQLNSKGHGAGACDYCHDSGTIGTLAILQTGELHHNVQDSASLACTACHINNDPGASLKTTAGMRACEKCHGPGSLHNIQADSPKTPTGTIIVGGETAGYGHQGRDAGPTDSDCWGCHAFGTGKNVASTPGIGPIIPTLYESDRTSIVAGTKTTVVLTGAAFTNTMGNTKYEVNVVLSNDRGSVTLHPDAIVDEGMLSVTIPANTLPGIYDLRASKANFSSNPISITVVPKVKVAKVSYSKNGTLTITGSGFAGYAKGSGTAVTGVVKGRPLAATTVSWTDTKIVAKIKAAPSKITVKSVFGTATKAL